MVYVLDIEGKPLMPTERHGRVRRMLREGIAHVVRSMPFTIQLDYDSERNTQPVSLGIDAGSSQIGVSATTEGKELYASQVELRTDIQELLATRRETRRTRRNRKTRYRKARFDNRRRKDGWLAPSVRNKVDAHITAIRRLHDILPITETSIEVAQFDVQKIKKPDIKGAEYQHGEQLGFWNVREYVLARDGHKCQYCKGKSKDPILNVHHIESRKTGGNAPNNLITLCETCHKAYHKGEIKDLKIKRGKSLRDAAIMNIMRWEVYDKAKELFGNVHLTYGYITKNTRICNEVVKTHVADARCISGNPKATPMSFHYVEKLIRRHNRQIHRAKVLKGGVRKLNQCPYEVFGYRLFDIVRYRSTEWLVKSRRTRGFFLLQVLGGTEKKDGLSYKKLSLVRRSRGRIIYKYLNKA